MQISCPECGERIPAEHINIQQLIAVCPVCHSVFPFELPAAKPKRRKVSQPQHLVLREADSLYLAYRTNFRLDQNQAFLSSALGSVFMTFVTLLLTGEYFAGDVPFLIPLMFGLLSLLLYYWLATIVLNKTQIRMDDLSIAVERGPLPGFFHAYRKINLSGVEMIYSEETPISKKEAYDTPRYHVWAEMVDGSRKVIVTDVIEDYAVFIARRLNDRLDADMPLDVTRLAGSYQEAYDVDNIDDVQATELSDNSRNN